MRLFDLKRLFITLIIKISLLILKNQWLINEPLNEPLKI